MLAAQILKTIRFIIIILCLSYFTGLFWLNFTQIILNIQEKKGVSEENFIIQYRLTDMSNYQKTIALMYFIFTTISTVGLGDFHPKSNSERVICSFVMLFGVMITSFLMQNLN